MCKVVEGEYTTRRPPFFNQDGRMKPGISFIPNQDMISIYSEIIFNMVDLSQQQQVSAKISENQKSQALSENMPLVILCGYPCSGKTKRAEELKNYFENSRGKTVHLTSDESLNLERNTVYAGKLAFITVLRPVYNTCFYHES